MSLRVRALRLYRQLQRDARTWIGEDTSSSGIKRDRLYIRTESRRRFEENRNLAEFEAEEEMKRATDWREIAHHYKICYPRVMHMQEKPVEVPMTASRRRSPRAEFLKDDDDW